MAKLYENKNIVLIIGVCFALWPLIIPFFVGVYLATQYQKHLNEKTKNIEQNAQEQSRLVAQFKEKLNAPEYVEYRDKAEARDRLAQTIATNNGLIADQQSRLESLRTTVEQLDKKEKTARRRLEKFADIYRSVEYAVSTYSQSADNTAPLLVGSDHDDFDELAPTVILHLHNMDMRDLQKAFRANNKEIESVLEQYLGRYTTKANKAIYQLMVLALRAELQNILTQLKYEKLDDAIEKVKAMTAKYLVIAGDGNQNIVSTLTKFIGQIEYLFINAVKIEYNYYVKKEQARQEQLAIREQMKIEAQERKALEAEKKRVEREESKYQEEIDRIQTQLSTAADAEADALRKRILVLQDQLSQVVIKKEEIANLQNGKAGNVYVISNLGSFGEDVFKIGMTRRLDPQDRVNELGSASVPFKFDVHCFIFSEDAVGLEAKLHERLIAQRLNKVNLRKEFFKVSLDDLEALVQEIDPTAEFTRTMAAEEYRQSLSSTEVYTVSESGFEDEDEDVFDE